jgi:hypothetical protein
MVLAKYVWDKQTGGLHQCRCSDGRSDTPLLPSLLQSSRASQVAQDQAELKRREGQRQAPVALAVMDFQKIKHRCEEL